MSNEVRCKTCRKLLFDKDMCKDLLVNAHNISLNETKNSMECPSMVESHNIFLSEDLLPEWIKTRIESEEWSKGRINCSQCDSRIGAFDFVSGTKCECTKYLLPPVHLIKSKIDLIKNF